MRWYANISLGLLILLLAGCGKDSTVKEIQEIHSTGNLTQAREKALDALEENPGNMDLWLEFAHIVADQTREAVRFEDDRALNYLIEASLICGAIYKYKNQNPSHDWRNVCRLCAAEATKQANQIQTTMVAQSQSVEYLNQLLSTPGGGDAHQSGARMSAARMVETYRTEARTLLLQSVLAARFLDMLPEVTSGSSTMILTQLQNSRDGWIRNLELTTDYTTPVQERANRAVDTAFERALGDLQTLGYFIPATIIENGILE